MNPGSPMPTPKKMTSVPPPGDQAGYTFVELLAVMLILGIVLAGLTTAFMSGSHAELTLNRRFQAQQQARLAIDRVRSDVHCASAAQAQTINTYPGVKLATAGCSTSIPTISWCEVPVTTSPAHYQLYRSTSTAAGICGATDATRVLVADNLTNASVFTTSTIPQFALQSIGINLTISVNPNATNDSYALNDPIVAGNSTRCATAGGCTPPSVP